MAAKKPKTKPRLKNLGGVKVTDETLEALKATWNHEAFAQESFGAWARRKLLMPMERLQ